jgi:uncharacterized membrane protein YphA (DoxX/SURF4 family)
MIGFGLLIARLCLAIVFLYSAVDKLWYWRSSIEEVKGDGLPWPVAFAGATVFTQLVGGCLVATGLFAWLGALVLAGFTVAATLVGHRFWLRRGTEFRHELTTSLEHVAIVGGLLLLSSSISRPPDGGQEMSDRASGASAAHSDAAHPPLSARLGRAGSIEI